MAPVDVRIITSHGKAGRCEDALQHLRSSRTGDARKDVFLYSAMIKVCGDLRKWSLAVQMLTTMQDNGIPPNLVCYNSAITACVKSNQAQAALDIVNSLLQRGVTVDQYTCSSALKAYACLNSWQAALQFLKMMSTTFNIKPNAHCYSAAVNACEKGGQWQRALELFQQMQDNHVQPTTITCTSVVSACKVCGQWQEALSVLTQMKTMGVPADAHTFSNAISACNKAGKWMAAIRTYEDMRSYNVEPTVVCFGAVLCACQKGKQWQVAMAILNEMKVNPDYIVYIAVLSTCCKCGRWAEAIHILRRMVGDGVKPDQRSFDMVIGACIQRGRCQEATELLAMATSIGINITKTVKIDLAQLRDRCDMLGCANFVKAPPGLLPPGEVVQKGVKRATGKSDRRTGESRTTEQKEITMALAESDQKDITKSKDNHTQLLRATPHQAFDMQDGSSWPGVLEGDAEFYNSNLCEHANNGAWEEAFKLLASMESAEIIVYSSSIGKVASACEKAGKHDEALLLQDQQSLLDAILAETIAKYPSSKSMPWLSTK